MWKTTRSGLVSATKMSLLALLAVLSFNVNAGSLYVGTPTRPNTIWIPGHCTHHGRYIKGYYLQFNRTPVTTRMIVWVGARYDRCCNVVPGHWRLRHHYYYCRHHYCRYHHHYHHHHHHRFNRM